MKVTPVVPLKAIKLLERNLTDDGELVRVGLRANDALFQTERAMIYTTLVQGRYPPYRDIIAKTRKEATVKIPLPVEAFFSPRPAGGDHDRRREQARGHDLRGRAR